MNIRYTRHARQRMAQRKISVEEVAETLESPDDVVPGDRGETIALRRYAYHEVSVIFEELSDEAVVVLTVIRTRIRR